MKLKEFALLADENIHPNIVLYLRIEGFDVKDAKETGLSGSADIDLLTLSFAEGRVILTQDADFGKIIYTQSVKFTGIVYLRPGHFAPAFHRATLQTLLQTEVDLQPPFLVIAENTGESVKIRVRNAIF